MPENDNKIDSQSNLDTFIAKVRNIFFATFGVASILGITALTAYLYKNNIAPTGIDLGSGVSFTLAALHISLRLLGYFVITFLFGSIATTIFYILCIGIEYYSLKKHKKNLNRQTTNQKKKTTRKKIIWFSVAYISFSVALLWFSINYTDLASTAAKWLIIVFSCFVFASSLIFFFTYHSSKDDNKIIDDPISKGFFELVKYISKETRSLDKNSFITLIIGSMALIVFILATGLFEMDEFINETVSHTGLASNNVTIILKKDSSLIDVAKQLKGAEMVGCAEGETYFLHDIDLVWHGLGNTSFLRFKNIESKIITIKSEEILNVAKNFSIKKYCQNFSGNYFEDGSITPSEKIKDINSSMADLKKNIVMDRVEKIEVEWSADPIYYSKGNSILSKERAKYVSELAYKEYMSAGPTEILVETKWNSSDFSQHNCKDWPNPKTKNECLAKNRGGKITVYVKNIEKTNK